MINKIGILKKDLNKKIKINEARCIKLKGVSLTPAEADEVIIYCDAIVDGSYNRYIEPFGEVKQLFINYGIELPKKYFCLG